MPTPEYISLCGYVWEVCVCVKNAALATSFVHLRRYYCSFSARVTEEDFKDPKKCLKNI